MMNGCGGVVVEVEKEAQAAGGAWVVTECAAWGSDRVPGTRFSH